MSARLGRIAAHLGRSASSSSSSSSTTSDAPPPRRGVQHEVAGAAGASVPCLDFGYSFISGAGPMCAIRFVVESRCTVYDDTAGTVKSFYQLASCKSEDTFGRGTARSGKNLFQDPNYDFCASLPSPSLPPPPPRPPPACVPGSPSATGCRPAAAAGPLPLLLDCPLARPSAAPRHPSAAAAGLALTAWRACEARPDVLHADGAAV